MVFEIQLLKENLKTDARGDSVKVVQQKLNSLIEKSNWEEAEAFFHDFYETFKDSSSDLGIVKNGFETLVDKLFVLIPNFEGVSRLNHLQNFWWFDSIQDVDYKKGYIAEHLATFSQGGGALIELQKARNQYRKAQRNEDASRIQAVISEKARSFNLWAPINPPASMVASIHAGAVGALQSWLTQDDDVRLSLLVQDYFGIRPGSPEPQTGGGDIYSSGLLHGLGAIQSIEISSDGRISSGKGAPPSDRIDFDCWDYTLRVFLDVFLPEVKNWLSKVDEEAASWEKIFGSLRHYLAWNENTAEHFYQGIAGWMHGFPQVALSFWLPQFESVLRSHLADLGEDVVSARSKVGLEDFITFDGLLAKAQNHYDDESIRYWRRIFSTENGLGWNLRHSFCHGFLPMRAMKAEIYALAVFQAYLFLIIPPQEEAHDFEESVTL